MPPSNGGSRMAVRSKFCLTAGAACALALISTTAEANHSWNGYHWRISSLPVGLQVYDSLSPTWDPYLDVALSDWNASSVLGLTKVPGGSKTKPCKADSGTIKVCSDAYGYTGWLGVAQVWTTGEHIDQAVTKLNDSYFAAPTYNTPEWRQLVTCQEIGHDFGLDHQDENFDNPNLDTCMDYTNLPASNQHPNAHDYEELGIIYSHTDTVSSGGGGGGGGGGGPPPGRGKNAGQDIGNIPSGWGKVTGYDGKGRPDTFELQLSNGQRVLTHVFWLPGDKRSH